MRPGDRPRSSAGLALFESVVVAGWTVEPAQSVYAGLLAVGGLGQYGGGRITTHVRPEPALVGTLGVLTVAAVAFVPASRLGAFLLVCGVLGLFLYSVAPIYQVAIATRAAEDVHGLSYGYTYLGMFGVGAVGAAMAGDILTRAGMAALFSALAAVAVLAMAVGVVLARRHT